jgi:hypothetical protein
MEVAKQLRDGATRTGIDDVRGDLVERNQDKDAVRQSWMRDGEIGFSDANVIHEKDIQIERTWPVGNVKAAIAAEFELDLPQLFKELVRRKRSFKRDSGIEKARLRGITDRSGGVER